MENKIREYIDQNLLFRSDGYQYSDDTSFLEEGIVDSQGVMELVMFVEEEFGVLVEDADIIPDNFDSISQLAAYIHRKKEMLD